MRYADGTLIGDLNDNVSATTTGSITTYTTSSINENQTNYSLLPVVVNQPPIIIKSMVEGSIPAIQAYPPKHRDPSTQDTGSTVLYRNSDGTVKVVVGASFTLRVEASQRGTVTTDNDGSFDMNVTNNFSCTPSGTFALTFTNITAGQSGYVLLINTGGHAVTAAATTKVNTSFLTTVSAAGTYLLSYFSNGTNVYVTTGGAMA